MSIYESPEAELEALSGERAPRWARRFYGAFGYPPDEAPLERVVHALGMELRERLSALGLFVNKVRGMGWAVRVEGGELVVSSGLAPERSEALLERAGVLVVARTFGRSDDDGRLLWDVALEEEPRVAS
ncbi:MAG TPA: hypothetical protein VIA06_15305 [Candidatus Dormibacteraeota bacterium]|jgi:hypothetical protein|nr:hypothetical protein [Candidatus Dormibacteraeota bacterium]